jgi:hypothetical protein
LPTLAENRPGPSRLIPDAPNTPERDKLIPLPPISPTESELDIEKGLDKSDFEANWVCWKGGVALLSFLINKAIPPIAALTTDPKSWGYKDIVRLPQLEQQEWHNACLQELEALRRRDVYKLVPRPKN